MRGTRTGRPNNVVGSDSVQDFLSIICALDVVETRDQHVELSLQALAEVQDLLLVVGIAHDAGHIPGALEKKWGEVKGDLAVATKE